MRLFHQALAYDKAGQPEAAAAIGKAVKKGLTARMLNAPEVPDFDRLRRSPARTRGLGGRTEIEYLGGSHSVQPRACETISWAILFNPRKASPFG